MEKNKKRKKEEYEICKVCRINHNEGRRHNYFPRHINTLSSLFSRFLHKLSLLNSPLSNPTPTLPNHSNSPPFWCIFCELDIDNNDSSFLSGNTIKHLASDDHLKNVKHFLWKYGRGKNNVDSFRVTEEKFSKWEKKCEVLKSKAGPASGIHRGTLCGELNDIQPNSQFLNNFDKNKSHFLESNLSNNVLPLQHDTNKNYQVCRSDMSEADKVGTSQQDRSSLIPEVCLNTWSSTFLDNGSAHLPSSAANLHADDRAHKGVCKNEHITNRESSLNGYPTLTRITSENSGNDKGNVYSGAPPPWLVGTDSAIDIGQSTTSRSNSAPKNCRKTSKLNPKRVGAAWADKRRKELEMEKRGETIADTSAHDWLPNFGSVWQSGSRKESMKEFKKEKVNVPMADSQLEAEVKIQPYVSKRRMVNSLL